METTVTPKSKTEVRIEIELSPEELLRYKEKAVEDLAKGLRVEGFRPGKIPQNIARAKLGEEAILVEAADKAVNESYSKTIQEREIEVVGEPDVSVLSLKEGEPFRFQVSVAHIPPFDLPDYQKIASLCNRKEVVVEESEIDRALEWLQKNRVGENENLPLLTDEFAQSLGQFSSLSELKESVREGLKQEKEMQETDRLRQDILERIGEETTIELPPVLIEREQRAMLDRVKYGVQAQLNISFEDYLEKMKKTEEQLLEGMREDARKRAVNYLVLREISKREQIIPTTEEIEKEEKVILSQYRGKKDGQGDLDADRVRAYTESAIRTEKTFHFLEALTKQS